jgi:hypothetical protein
MEQHAPKVESIHVIPLLSGPQVPSVEIVDEGEGGEDEENVVEDGNVNVEKGVPVNIPISIVVV